MTVNEKKKHRQIKMNVAMLNISDVKQGHVGVNRSFDLYTLYVLI